MWVLGMGRTREHGPREVLSLKAVWLEWWDSAAAGMGHVCVCSVKKEIVSYKNLKRWHVSVFSGKSWGWSSESEATWSHYKLRGETGNPRSLRTFKCASEHAGPPREPGIVFGSSERKRGLLVAACKSRG